MKRITLIALTLMLAGCSSITAITHYHKSTDHFIPHHSDPRVLYEPGAEEFADKVAQALPKAIESVEKGHYQPFAKPDETRVYVCATEDSFHDLTGRNVKGIVMHKLFLSPRLMKEPNLIPEYLTHELSHLHLKQEMPLYRFLGLPFWFMEGLATQVSNGGGAHLVSKEKAIEAIKSGRHFKPHGKGSILFKKSPSRWGLKPHMMYRQSKLFLDFLKETDENDYRQFLERIQSGDDIDNACVASFGKSLEEMWNEFAKQTS